MIYRLSTVISTTKVEKCQEKYALKMLFVSRGLHYSRTKALNSKSYKIKNAEKTVP